MHHVSRGPCGHVHETEASFPCFCQKLLKSAEHVTYTAREFLDMTEFGHRKCGVLEIVDVPMRQTEAKFGETCLAVTLKQTVPKPCYEVIFVPGDGVEFFSLYLLGKNAPPGHVVTASRALNKDDRKQPIPLAPEPKRRAPLEL
jgi:hypothetical protein